MVYSVYDFYFFFFSSIRRHTRCALVTGVQTCALPIFSANHAASRPRGCQARLTASMPLHTLPYSSGAAWGAPREVRGCGFMSGLLFVWPWTVWPGRDVDRQEKGAEGRVAFGSGGRNHPWAVAGPVVARTVCCQQSQDRKSTRLNSSN